MPIRFNAGATYMQATPELNEAIQRIQYKNEDFR
jgi:hypothetical protein